jgi:hypothetical protein
MLEPDVLLDSIVTAYRACPGLVAEMNGDSDRIRAYRDSIEQTNYRVAILQLGAPGILVMYDGDYLSAFNGDPVRRYQFSIIYRGRPTNKSESPSGTGHLRYLLEKAVPAGSSVPLRSYRIHSSCYEMDPTTNGRESVMVSMEGDTIDYFRVRMSLAEIGDE